MKIVVPLAVVAVAANLARANQARVVGRAFREKKYLAIEGLCGLMDFVCQLFEESVRRVIQNRVHRVQTQRIDVKLLNPVKRVIDKVAAHRIAIRPVKVQRRAPWRLVAVGKVRAEFGEIISLRPEMVVDHIENHRQAKLMTSVDQAFETPRSAVGILHGEGQHAVVAPVAATGELRHRHQFDGRDAEVFELGEMRHDGVERASAGEGANVELVDNVAR